jgi:hypothetical protein
MVTAPVKGKRRDGREMGGGIEREGEIEREG